MRVQQGGTRTWCPNCKEVRVCRAENPHQVAGDSGQMWQRPDHKDITWFRRLRICKECNHRFLTAELEEKFVEELVTLRSSLVDVKKRIGTFAKQSASAARSLDDLSRSLRALKALRQFK